jgi:hypothetical protein
MYYLYGIERLIQLSTASAIVTRKIATRRRKLMGKVLTDLKVTRTTEIVDAQGYYSV